MAESKLKQMLQRQHERRSEPHPLPKQTSMKSDASMLPPILFDNEPPSANQRSEIEVRPHSIPKQTSMKDDASMLPPILFDNEPPSANQSQVEKSKHGSMDEPISFQNEHSANQSSETDSITEARPRGNTTMSDSSMNPPITFKNKSPSVDQR
ncbi:hypothetical protein WMY93_015290 [Mugilogobius chulae]|uniref:Uncharacterized protein n=1 Tax=Mugilogobius chulae TaxID=88201 RepID=A0AAW0NU25_9GOBI